jgi:hypothetical protein
MTAFKNNASWTALPLLFVVGSFAYAADPAVTRISDFSSLPANAWTLIAHENADGGKAFATLVSAESVDRLYLWGLGGKMPDRSRFVRYELESFSPGGARWIEAFPETKRQSWTDGKWKPFRIYGQEGTDGPRMHVIGSGSPNVVAFYEFEGIERPSPIYTFNQACWDSKRNRIVYFGGGKTFALDPATNTWTDLAPSAAPITCDSLAWASQCYDPLNDEVLLFGGGAAFNAEGGARTWLYDCAKNAWYRLNVPRDQEPPLRCTGPIVYDAKNQAMVLFGGYDQSAALNDTWVFHCKERRWEKRTPSPSPPPMFDPAAASLPGGFVLVCGASALLGTRTHSATWDNKETWVYDVAQNTWKPAGGDLKAPATRWLTAAGSQKHGVAFLVTIGQDRRTYAFRHDPVGPAVERSGSAPGTMRYKYHDQKESLEKAPKPDLAAHAKFLAALPANQFVDAKPPGLVIAKTWSGATIDTDRGEVIYTGGGHSGYSGNDVAHYSIAANRWSLDAPPRFPPYLESTNAAVYGWSYGARPWSQHTYLWYGYDPVSKRIVYCARPGIRDGSQVFLDEDPAKTCTYDRKKHGHWTWTYDPAAKKFSLPCFGRPFENPWDLSLVGTPRGVYASAGDSLYLAAVKDGAVEWKPLAGKLPAPKGKNYNYEWRPLVYDAKRGRLLHLMGDHERVELHAWALDGSAWEELASGGRASIGREAFCVPRHDVLLMLSRDRLLVLDLEKLQWREMEVAMPKGVYGTEAAMVYAPGLDVSVLLLPSHFSGPLQTFLFRFEP